ncbi:FecR family protein [Autumnicola psychrophila]|uniref:FecR family protein n=1 Tax=Autumnicola psychrophila TaxID=3075592 RepID=A0ABU3DMQ0_9FLAO|nr:FecR family protein [Zunongwangia sp. F225]MDT0684995.1 FecR family protein [Zunongwangia sp. F225]
MKNYESDIAKKIEASWKSYYKEVPKSQVEVSWRDFEKHFSKRKWKDSRKHFFKVSGAAAVLLFLFTGYLFLDIYNSNIHVVNNSYIDKEIILPDGSLVLLKPNSEINYKGSFKNLRGVDLIGEAFFKVVKDNSKVFKVKTGATTTTVLGTSFNVSQERGLKDVKIALYSGEILVSVIGRAESWSIIPGERFVYEKDKIFIEKFENDLSFQPGVEFIDVNNVEFKNLLDFLEERFDYKFQKNIYTKNKHVTLRVNKSDSIKQVLNILSIINKFNYEINSKTKEIKILKK